MSRIPDLIDAMRRPRLLIRAARFGLEGYNRKTVLKRLLQTESLPGQEAVLERLLLKEQRLEEARHDRGATYSFERHIDFLIAIMAEARLLPRKASA